MGVLGGICARGSHQILLEPCSLCDIKWLVDLRCSLVPDCCCFGLVPLPRGCCFRGCHCLDARCCSRCVFSHFIVWVAALHVQVELQYDCTEAREMEAPCSAPRLFIYRWVVVQTSGRHHGSVSCLGQGVVWPCGQG